MLKFTNSSGGQHLDGTRQPYVLPSFEDSAMWSCSKSSRLSKAGVGSNSMEVWSRHTKVRASAIPMEAGNYRRWTSKLDQTASARYVRGRTLSSTISRSNGRPAFTRDRQPTKLHTLYLQQLPMGKLPAGLGTWGSNLQNLNLSGSLLSQLVNFSTLSNLQKLNIAETNVKEVRGIDRLTKIESLDFSYCCRLQKIPDLNRLSKLAFLSLAYCTRLKAVPRIPPEYHRGNEFGIRLGLGFRAAIGLISSHAKFDAKVAQFESRKRGSETSPVESALQSTDVFHRGIQCDGCGQFPLRGPRFKAKNKTFHIKLCSTCFTNRCNTRKCQATRLSIGGHTEYFYDLCLKCFTHFGGNAEDFICIDKTER